MGAEHGLLGPLTAPGHCQVGIALPPRLAGGSTHIASAVGRQARAVWSLLPPLCVHPTAHRRDSEQHKLIPLSSGGQKPQLVSLGSPQGCAGPGPSGGSGEDIPCLFQLLEFLPAFLSPSSVPLKHTTPASASVVSSPPLTPTLLPPSSDVPGDDIGPTWTLFPTQDPSLSLIGRVLSAAQGNTLRDPGDEDVGILGDHDCAQWMQEE